MKLVQILGTGCAKCEKLTHNVAEATDVSRRRFLGTVGMGAASVGTLSAVAAEGADPASALTIVEGYRCIAWRHGENPIAS